MNCPLHKDCDPIPGRGSANPKVVFVGETPGPEEVTQRKVFVGPSGQLLLQAIKEYNLLPAYLTNVRKCVGETGYGELIKTPTKAEVETCKPGLMDELKKLHPRAYVAVGNVAVAAFTGKMTGILDASGQRIGTFNGSPVYALMHPSYVLRTPRDLSKFEMHCRAIASALGDAGAGVSAPEPKEVSTGFMLDVLHRPSTSPVSIDIETNAKFAQFGGFLRCFGLADENGAYWTPVDDGNQQFLLEAFAGSARPKICYNLTFEARWALDAVRMEVRNLLWDPMAMHFLLDENSSHALDAVASQYLNALPWDAGMAAAGWDWANVPMKVLGPYNGKDAWWTRKLAFALWKKMTPGLQWHYRHIQLPSMKVAARMEHRGMYLCKEWSRELGVELERQMDRRSSFMLNLPEVAKIRAFLEKKGKELNFNSDRQMAELFFGVMNLPQMMTTESGKPSVREEALKLITKPPPVLSAYLEWKTRKKIHNDFVTKFPAMVDEQSCIHPHFNACAVVTGRFSVRDPNAQAIPEDENVRGMFASRTPGGRIISCDYSQLELRLVASESGEPRMIEAFKKGEDIHGTTARLVFGDEFTKRQRSIAKRINFGIIYGAGAQKLVNEFAMSWDEAEKILYRVQKAYPKLFRWKRTVEAEVMRRGYVFSRWGRFRRFPGISSLPDFERSHALRQAVNFVIASLGADLTNRAMVHVDRKLRKGKYKSFVVLQMHDSLLTDAFPSEAPELSMLIPYWMVEFTKDECPWLRVDLAVDVTVGDRWGALDEIRKEEPTPRNAALASSVG